ncbi:unnamed protein product [Notodromas monacha]|uniref:Anoctamin n=1 Tax=Notodromas monacha TaxID=399045 RepID=A0A7R9BSC5_9CRUS|nr:unnamed protein product [Notodromas monacha]CAG0919431.1 unnamed protein product [Notodromas monacha]
MLVWLDLICNYFGVKIAFYFAWLGHYTTALLLPGIAGLAYWCGFCNAGDQVSEDAGFVLLAVVNVIWATVFLEAWKRKEKELAYKWGTLDQRDELLTDPRPMYTGPIEVSPVTGILEPCFAPWKRNVVRYVFSFPLMLFCLTVVSGVMWTMLQIQDYWDDYLEKSFPYLTVASYIPKVIMALLVTFFDWIYKHVAVWLNDLENYRGEEHYQNHLIVKLVLFQFVNSFVALFYVAFYLRDMEKLRDVRQRKRRKDEEKEPSRSSTPQRTVSQAELELQMPKYDGTFEDYSELFIQFGYVAFFSSAFPLASLWALFNNIIEIRTDAFKLCYVLQRPFGERVQGIGAWQKFPINEMPVDYSESMEFSGGLQHVMLILRGLLRYCIPDIPSWIATEMAKIEFSRRTAARNIKMESTRGHAVFKRQFGPARLSYLHGVRAKVYDPLSDDCEGAGSSPGFFSKAETRKWLLLLTIGAAVVYAARVTMPLCLVAMSTSQKWSKKDSGSLLSAFFWGYALTQVPGGTLSDRIGGEVVLLWSSMVWSFMTFMHPVVVHLFAGSKTWVIQSLLVVRVIMGGAQGMFFPAVASLSSRKLSKLRRSAFFARASSGSSLGTIFIGSVGSLLLASFSWEMVFLVISMLSLIWLWALYSANLRVSSNRVVTLSDPATLLVNRSDNEPIPWSAYLSKFSLWAVIICHVAQNFCWFLLISWMPTYFAEDIAPKHTGSIFGVLNSAGAVPGFVGVYFAGYVLETTKSWGFVFGTCALINVSGCLVFLLFGRGAMEYSWTSLLFFLLVLLRSSVSWGSAVPFDLAALSPMMLLNFTLSPDEIVGLKEIHSTEVSFAPVLPDGKPLDLSSLPDDCLITLKVLNDQVVNITTRTVFHLNDTDEFGDNFTFTLRGRFLGRTEVELVLKNKQGVIFAQRRLPVSVVRPMNTLNHIFIYSIIALVSMAYINMGSTLDFDVVKKVVMKPVAPAVGLACQYGFMPLVSFALSQLCFEEPTLQLGLFVTGISPGGGASNIWTVVLNGNINLSITMTFISTLAAFAMMPAWIFSLGRIILKKGDLYIPYEKIGLMIVILLALITIGILIRCIFPRLAGWLVRIIKPLSAILLVYIFTFGIYANLYIIRLLTWEVVTSAVSLIWVGFVFGAVVSKMLNFGKEDIIAIAIETGIQNMGVAILFLYFSLPQLDADMTLVVPITSAVAMPVPLTIGAVIVKLKEFLDKHRSAKDEEAAVSLTYQLRPDTETSESLANVPAGKPGSATASTGTKPAMPPPQGPLPPKSLVGDVTATIPEEESGTLLSNSRESKNSVL